MRQNPVGEPAATAALNFGTPRRRSSLKRLRPFCHCRQRYERNLRRIHASRFVSTRGDFDPFDRLRLVGSRKQLRPNAWPVLTKVVLGVVNCLCLHARRITRAGARCRRVPAMPKEVATHGSRRYCFHPAPGDARRSATPAQLVHGDLCRPKDPWINLSKWYHAAACRTTASSERRF